MMKIECDLRFQTCEEIIEEREQLERALARIATYTHERLAGMSDEEKVMIAQALAIDLDTGEWLAGA